MSNTDNRRNHFDRPISEISTEELLERLRGDKPNRPQGIGRGALGYPVVEVSEEALQKMNEISPPVEPGDSGSDQ